MFVILSLFCFKASRRSCLDLCLKHNTDCFMNMVGSRTQFSVSYAYALLVPCWQLMSFSCTFRAGCLDNVVLVRQFTFLLVV